MDSSTASIDGNALNSELPHAQHTPRPFFLLKNSCPILNVISDLGISCLVAK